MKRKRIFILMILAMMTLTIALGTAWAIKTEEGEKLTGKHYTLNIIGVPKDKTADMTGTKGHTIFVPLNTQGRIDNSVKIYLTEGEFEVIDRNGTDSDGATFQLPNPDPDNTGTTLYSVYARELGTPGGTATMTTCAEDAGGETYCSYYVLELKRTKGKPRTRNVSKELLYIYADLGSGFERIPLFSDELENYFWKYDNNGLKLLQLRFYVGEDYQTQVPDPLKSITPSCGEPGDSLTVALESHSSPKYADFSAGVAAVSFGDGIDVLGWAPPIAPYTLLYVDIEIDGTPKPADLGTRIVEVTLDNGTELSAPFEVGCP